MGRCEDGSVAFKPFNSEHSDVALSSVLDVKLVKPVPLRADRDFCQIETIRHDRSDSRDTTLKRPECRARSTVAGDL